MSRNRDFDNARNELFSHIHRCGVLGATEEQQGEWMEDTIGYLGERFETLTREQLAELKTIGLRFCQPVIVRGERTEAPADSGAEESELAGAA